MSLTYNKKLDYIINHTEILRSDTSDHKNDDHHLKHPDKYDGEKHHATSHQDGEVQSPSFIFSKTKSRFVFVGDSLVDKNTFLAHVLSNNTVTTILSTLCTSLIWFYVKIFPVIHLGLRIPF